MHHLAVPNANAWPPRARFTRVLTAPLIVSLAFLGSAAPARADLTINATFDSSIANSPGAEAAIYAAISNITSSINSPNNLSVSIYFQTGGGLGSSAGGLYQETYYDYYNALKAVANSADQLTALASLGRHPPPRVRPAPSMESPMSASQRPRGGISDSTRRLSSSALMDILTTASSR